MSSQVVAADCKRYLLNNNPSVLNAQDARLSFFGEIQGNAGRRVPAVQ